MEELKTHTVIAPAVDIISGGTAYTSNGGVGTLLQDRPHGFVSVASRWIVRSEARRGAREGCDDPPADTFQLFIYLRDSIILLSSAIPFSNVSFPSCAFLSISL